jgi:acetolactate synthase-1/2/3 large subunit
MRSLAEKRKADQRLKILPEEPAAPVLEPKASADTTLVSALVNAIHELGIEQSFGVSGGAIALLFDALQESPIELLHFRHESGAAFSAAEAYFATGKPSLVFATTGPGTLNVLTGLTAARWDGAKVILISGATSAAQRGRWATQETSSYTLPQDVLYCKGPIFDYAIRMEHPSEFNEVIKRLSLGVARPGGFVAHVCLPMSLQSGRVDLPEKRMPTRQTAPTISNRDIEMIARLLKPSRFGIWAGFGATSAAPLVQELVERSGAKVFCSPRAKGVVPENHPQFVGVTGLGGHESVTEYMVQEKPSWVLVLGSRLGEATSFWDRDMEPSEGFIHVDIDPEIPGTAYPDARTIGIQAEIGYFVNELLEHFPKRAIPRVGTNRRPWSEPVTMRLAGRSPVRPQVLMDSIQKHVVQGSDALVLSECGNSFAWCNHHLRFDEPARYRVSTLFGSMGHMTAGVVGAAVARKGKAVAVVGDGSMLMNSEISTAAQYHVQAVWVVLNDSGYGMCRDGHQALGLTDQQVDFPRVDFVNLARSMGADGVRVESEDMLDVAFEEAMKAEGPFVIDVHIDPNETSPLLRRFESLIKQGNAKNVAGWET